MEPLRFSVLLLLFRTVHCDSQQERFVYSDNGFFCPESNQWVSSRARCNGVFDCYNGEDERDCESLLLYEGLTQEDPGKEQVPEGFVKLPEQYQQKRLIQGMESSSRCGLIPQDTATTCQIPWMKPRTSYYFDPKVGYCNSFTYTGGCNMAASSFPDLDVFPSFEECMATCQAQGTGGQSASGCSLDGDQLVPPDAPISAAGVRPDFGSGTSQTSSSFYCSDGLILGLEFVCNGNPDCAFGEDEANCFQANIDNVVYPGSGSSILELNSGNLDRTIATSEKLLVKFHDPRCEVCEEFKPEFMKAYKKSKQLGLGVTFAQVDIEAHPEQKQKVGTNGYPVIILYVEGNKMFKYYRNYGMTAHHLVGWLVNRLEVVSSMSMLGANLRPCLRPYLEFQCDNGMCLTDQYVCDRIFQCDDGSDEMFCMKFVGSEPPQQLPQNPSYGADIGGASNSGSTPDAPKPDPKPSSTPNPSPKPSTTTAKPPPLITEPTESQVGGAERPNELCDFKCGGGECQPSENRCNGVVDCADGLDEVNCGICRRTEFTCKTNGECVPYLKRCDGVPDCRDRSDESLCLESGCRKTEFICDDNTCTSFSLRCDGNPDCPDGSDEHHCPERCNQTAQFTCNSGRCIDIGLRCDGIPNCHDSTDEVGCGEAFISGQCDPESEWECSDGRRCVDKRRRCDGYPDCADLSDEDSELCHQVECDLDWQFQCKDRQRCIDKRRKCDGYPDCYDFSDEKQCTNVTCEHWQFKCVSDGICINEGSRCDHQRDCLDGSDEYGCSGYVPIVVEEYLTSTSPPKDPCEYWQFECIVDGICIDGRKKCDRTQDCIDGSDEQECPESIPEQTEHPFLPDGHPEVDESTFDDGLDYLDFLDYPETTTSDENAWELKEPCGDLPACPHIYDPVCGNDGTTYPSLCQLEAEACKSKKVKELKPLYAGLCVEDDYETVGEVKCSEYQIPCDDGTCISLVSQCDGTRDCSNGEDELYCQIGEEDQIPEAYCSDFQIPCKNGSCVEISAQCDGVRDCPEGEDEEYCQSIGEGKGFTCKDGRFLDDYRKCDGFPDCDEGEDEFDCPSEDENGGRADIPSENQGMDFEDLGVACDGFLEFRCRNGYECVSIDGRCNGIIDCVDGSDEADCEHKYVDLGRADYIEPFDDHDDKPIPEQQPSRSPPGREGSEEGTWATGGGNDTSEETWGKDNDFIGTDLDDEYWWD